MVPAQSDSAVVAVSGLNLGRRLVGSWTSDLNPSDHGNVVPSGPRVQSAQPNLVDSAGRGALILVWNLQS
jgi:hypothetical protein